MGATEVISIIVPVYRCEDCLIELHRRIREHLTAASLDYELIFVEDGGPDGSWKVIQRLAAQDSKVKGVLLSRNFGQHHAITAGLHACTGDWAVVMDCDLQDPPEAIPHLYRKAKEEGFDVVLARRMRRKDPLLKRLQAWIFYSVFNYFTGMQYDGTVGNFRIISRKVVDQYRLFGEQLRFFGGMIDWMGFPVAKIDVEHGERFAGGTSYTLAKLFRLGGEAIIAYSDKPLKIAVRIGLAVAGAAVLFGGYQLYKRLFLGVAVTGWSSLIVSIYFLGGLTIFLLGVIGIYLSKIYQEAKRRPVYIVRQTVNLSSEPIWKRP